MRRYAIKKKFWSWGDTFHVFNEQQEPVLQVQGKAFSCGDKLSMQTLDGQELAFIEQKLFRLMPSYTIHRNGQPFAEITKEWSWFKRKFTLDVPGPNDYSITGSFWLPDYEFTRRGRTVATISKTHWSWTNTYGIEIDEDEDDIAILSTCIVIDQVLHDDNGD